MGSGSGKEIALGGDRMLSTRPRWILGTAKCAQTRALRYEMWSSAGWLGEWVVKVCVSVIPRAQSLELDEDLSSTRVRKAPREKPGRE